MIINKLRKVLQILIFVLATIAVLLLGLAIHHLLTKESAQEYLPENAKSYIVFDSIREFYDDIIDLHALEIVLTTDNLKDFYTLLTDFKSNSYSDSFLFKELLKLKVYTVLHQDLSPSLIIDPGFKGIITRWLPLFINKLNSEDIEILHSTTKGRKVYTIIYKKESSYNLQFEENLIILTLNEENLKTLINGKDRNEGLRVEKELKELKKHRVNNSILDMYINTKSIVNDFKEIIEFPSLGVVSANITNNEIALEAYTKIQPKDNKIENLVNHRASPMGILKNLPDTTNIYTTLNFKSFKDLYNVITLIDNRFVLDDYELLIKSLSSLSSQELLFNWTGSEAGFLTLETAPEPIIFIDIANSEKLDNVLKELNNSLILDITNNLIIDNNRINQFKLSAVLKKSLEVAKKPSDLPYFIIDDDYLILSMNPELLSQFLTKKENNELLIKDKTYKSITKKSPKNANLFIYYDLNSALPRFLTNNNSMTKLFKEYEKGVITASYNADSITINLNAENSISNRTTLFPGYPKKIKKINSPITIVDIKGGSSKELIYTTSNNNLIISDINATPLSTTQVGRHSQIIGDNNKNLLVIDKDGVLYKINSDGEIQKPYPVFTTAKNSFPPVKIQNSLLLYSSINKTLGKYSLSGEILKEFESKKQIFNKPVILDDIIFYYPKTLFGTIEATTLNGEKVEGWPQKAMGISFSGPFIIDNKIGFLTQKGDLFLWNKNGRIIKNFPIKLDGVYYSAPVIFNNKFIVTINGSGLISVISLKGEIVHKRVIDRFKGRDTKLTNYSDMIFIYGSSNYIAALNNKLQYIQGFPVKGFYKPVFEDINSDGFIEMISPGYDNKLYIYTIRK